MNIKLPKLSLVVMVGVSGSGKSSFAKRHFTPYEVLSSDFCRGLVSDDENSQTSTGDAFDVLNFIASKRLAGGRLTVIDATNVQIEARKPLVTLARQFHTIPVAIVLDLPEKLCHERNKARPDRTFGPHVIRTQHSQLRRSMRNLKREGFSHVYYLSTVEEIENTVIERTPLWNDLTHLQGPFDIIGDIHGCFDELVLLLNHLGYVVDENRPEGLFPDPFFSHPQGRKAIFLGDIVDRGPRILDSLKLVFNMVKGASGLCVPGNHDIKFKKKLDGRDVQITHGLEQSIREFESLTENERKAFLEKVLPFLDGLISHYVLDSGRLVVAHAGLRQDMQGRGSPKVRDFCMYGETTGETDEFGLPVRNNWAAGYRGPATVVYGHTPVPEVDWLNRTINIDTGCVFGGKLTALCYPEKEIVSIPAKKVYFEPTRPFLSTPIEGDLTAQQEQDDVLDAEDVLGKRFITTRLRTNVSIREENAIAALEVMSRFAVNPKWLIYLPPTMSPAETTKKDGYLEYPLEAFSYFRSQGIPKVVCEEKHMGSRAVVILAKKEEAITKHFGIVGEGPGIIYTRTGRKFFHDPKIEQDLIQRFGEAIERSGFWSQFQTEWACFDCELMPWSEKAQELLRSQYAAVGASGIASLSNVLENLKRTSARSDLETGFELPTESQAKEFSPKVLLEKCQSKLNSIVLYRDAWRRYCWQVRDLNDLKLAPFHLLAVEGRVFADQDHEWHMNTLKEICRQDEGVLLPTKYLTVDLTDETSINSGCVWWEQLTGAGNEGMVVKPLTFIAKGKTGLAQPAVKVRGKEYLRIIYGPEYDSPENLPRLRSRALAGKRSLALREFALGIEGLERFVRKEPLRRVHECVFGVLALESEPIDPRL